MVATRRPRLVGRISFTGCAGGSLCWGAMGSTVSVVSVIDSTVSSVATSTSKGPGSLRRWIQPRLSHGPALLPWKRGGSHIHVGPRLGLLTNSEECRRWAVLVVARLALPDPPDECENEETDARAAEEEYLPPPAGTAVVQAPSANGQRRQKRRQRPDRVQPPETGGVLGVVDAADHVRAVHARVGQPEQVVQDPDDNPHEGNEQDEPPEFAAPRATAEVDVLTEACPHRIAETHVVTPFCDGREGCDGQEPRGDRSGLGAARF